MALDLWAEESIERAISTKLPILSFSSLLTINLNKERAINGITIETIPITFNRVRSLINEVINAINKLSKYILLLYFNPNTSDIVERYVKLRKAV